MKPTIQNGPIMSFDSPLTLPKPFDGYTSEDLTLLPKFEKLLEGLPLRELNRLQTLLKRHPQVLGDYVARVMKDVVNESEMENEALDQD